MTRPGLHGAVPRRAGPVLDHRRHDACAEVIATLCDRCREGSDTCWRALADGLVRLGPADTAGVDLGTAETGVAVGDIAALPSHARDALAERLAREPRIVHWHDEREGAFYAATAIVPGDDAVDGFLWARRDRAFEWSDVLPLRWSARFAGLVQSYRRQVTFAELQVRESRHRSSNDLQLVSGLLNFEARRRDEGEVREALMKISERVLALVGARRADGGALTDMVRAFVAALAAQVEERGITIDVRSSVPPGRTMTEQRRGVLMIAVNECVTNALKHGFGDDAHGGIRIDMREDDRRLVVLVDDDGAPPPGGCAPRAGSGLDLVARMLAGTRGRLTLPTLGSKVFTIEVPLR